VDSWEMVNAPALRLVFTFMPLRVVFTFIACPPDRLFAINKPYAVSALCLAFVLSSHLWESIRSAAREVMGKLWDLSGIWEAVRTKKAARSVSYLQFRSTRSNKWAVKQETQSVRLSRKVPVLLWVYEATRRCSSALSSESL
jgi:hypothetical protein